MILHERDTVEDLAIRGNLAAGKPIPGRPIQCEFRADGSAETIPSKLVTTLHKGDRVLVETAGGGGYGDARARAPDAHAADIADGKVSADVRLYGVGRR